MVWTVYLNSLLSQIINEFILNIIYWIIFHFPLMNSSLKNNKSIQQYFLSSIKLTTCLKKMEWHRKKKSETRHYNFISQTDDFTYVCVCISGAMYTSCMDINKEEIFWAQVRAGQSAGHRDRRLHSRSDQGLKHIEGEAEKHTAIWFSIFRVHSHVIYLCQILTIIL
jgi:hypothetical protein